MSRCVRLATQDGMKQSYSLHTVLRRLASPRPLLAHSRRCCLQANRVCQHRMACISYDFHLLKQSACGLILESKASVRRYFDEVPLTPDEMTIVEQAAEKIEQALKRILLKREG